MASCICDILATSCSLFDESNAIRKMNVLNPQNRTCDQKCGVWLLKYNQHATYQTKASSPLSILKHVLRSMSHILERRKEYLGSADTYGFKFVVPLETILKGN